ncbi:hypothetical protein SprV_0301219900 [Sparganum proliferum]
MPHPWNRYTNVDEFGPQHERLIYRNNFWWLYNPEEPVLDHCHRPLRQKWNGYPFLHSTRHNKLLNEHETTIIPRDARLFYNEEDWIKYKEIVRAPSLPGLGLRESYVLCVLMDAHRDERPWTRIAYTTDGYLLNHGRMHFQSRRPTTTVHELLADDCAINTTSEGDVQMSMDFFAAACKNFSRIIKTEKTAVMHLRPPNTAHNAPQVTVNGTQLHVVDNFTTKLETYEAVIILTVLYVDLDGVHEAGTQTQPLPPHLSSSNTEAELVGPDLRHGHTGADGNPRHLHYAETTATTMERPPHTDGRRDATQTTLLWRRRDGFTPIRSSPELKRFSENLREAPVDQPPKLEISCLGTTYMVENSEDRCSNLRSQPHHRCQSQTREMQISTAAVTTAASTPTPNHFQPAHDVNGHSRRQLDLLGTFGPTAAPGLHQQSPLRPPLSRLPRRQITLTAFRTITTILLLLLHPHYLNVCRCGVCHAHQHYTQS